MSKIISSLDSDEIANHLVSVCQRYTAEKPAPYKERFMAKVFTFLANKQRRLEDNSRVKLKGVHPKLVTMVHLAALFSSVDFVVFEGKRTLKRQKLLYQQKRTKTIYGSAHLYGLAVDLVPRTESGNLTWNDLRAFRDLSRYVKFCAKIADVEIVWGGDWKSFVDMAHWQLPPEEVIATAAMTSSLSGNEFVHLFHSS